MVSDGVGVDVRFDAKNRAKGVRLNVPTVSGCEATGVFCTDGAVSGTSCDLMDQQTLTAPEEVSEFQNSNTFDLFWENLLADPNQPQLTPINLDQPEEVSEFQNSNTFDLFWED